jgi:hypothetical protein
MDDGIFTPKDVAVRAVGRTVVNFQRLEHCLKGLARLGGESEREASTDATGR